MGNSWLWVMRFCDISQQPPACKHLRFAPAWNCFLLKDKSLWLGLVLLCPLGVRMAALCSAPPGCGAPRLPGPRHGPIRHRTTARGNKSPPQAAADIRAWRTQENLEITQLYSSQHRATQSRGETSRRQGKAASKPVCEPLPNPSSCRRRNIPALLCLCAIVLQPSTVFRPCSTQTRCLGDDPGLHGHCWLWLLTNRSWVPPHRVAARC